MSKQIKAVQLAFNMLKSGTSVSTARAFAKRQNVKTEFNRELRKRIKNAQTVGLEQAMTELQFSMGRKEREMLRRDPAYLKTHRRVFRKLVRGLRTRKLFINSLEEANIMRRILDGGFAINGTVPGEAWNWAYDKANKIVKNAERYVNRSMKRALVKATREEFALTKVSLTQGIDLSALSASPKANDNEVFNMRKERKAIKARLKKAVHAMAEDMKAFGRWLDVTLLSPLTCHLLAARRGVQLAPKALNELKVYDHDGEDRTSCVHLRARAMAYTC
jgi:hypothetical protein